MVMNVIQQKGTIKSEAIFSKCGKHRYVLRRSFESDAKELSTLRPNILKMITLLSRN
jgi:hypothetical protein